MASSNTPMVLSQISSIGIEKVAPAPAGRSWCQFYPQQDRAAGRRYLELCQASGCKAVVVTVDQQASNYERSIRHLNLGDNPRPTFRGRGDAARRLGRRCIARQRTDCGMRGAISTRSGKSSEFRGRQRHLDRRGRACASNTGWTDIVSNHGGRSMDYGPSTLEVLPEIVAAVGGRMAVITDSGYRRGADILKALALGANAVMLGRPTRWALGAFGSRCSTTPRNRTGRAHQLGRRGRLCEPCRNRSQDCADEVLVSADAGDDKYDSRWGTTGTRVPERRCASLTIVQFSSLRVLAPLL